jgi:tRNA (guanine-N7-)-methyltransferase
MRLKSKPWAKPLIASQPHRVSDDASVLTLPKGYQTYALEIGTGKGDFIVGKAKQTPSTFFLGIERATTVLAFALKKVVENDVANVHFILGDFAKASFHMQEHVFDTIYLNFSDPWPKLRHHKRRLTSQGFLDKISRILKPGGTIKMKTDNLDLFDFSISNFAKNDYNIFKLDRPYNTLDEDDIASEYEQFFRQQNLPIYRVYVQRK